MMRWRRCIGGGCGLWMRVWLEEVGVPSDGGGAQGVGVA